MPEIFVVRAALPAQVHDVPNGGRAPARVSPVDLDGPDHVDVGRVVAPHADIIAWKLRGLRRAEKVCGKDICLVAARALLSRPAGALAEGIGTQSGDSSFADVVGPLSRISAWSFLCPSRAL